MDHDVNSIIESVKMNAMMMTPDELRLIRNMVTRELVKRNEYLEKWPRDERSDD